MVDHRFERSREFAEVVVFPADLDLLEECLVEGVKGIPVARLRELLDVVVDRADYPTSYPYYPEASNSDIKKLVFKVLKARKSEAFAYAAMLIEMCESETDLPQALVEILLQIDEDLKAEPEPFDAPVASTEEAAGPESDDPADEEE